MKRTLITALVAMGMVAAAQAQMETSLNAGVNLTDGNSETLAANASLITATADKDATDRTTIGVKGNYGEVDSETTVQDVEGFANYKRVLSDPIYGYLDASILHDDIAAIDSRITVGAGVGTYLLKDDAASLGVELGLQYITEELGAPGEDGSDSDDYVAIHFGQTYTRQLSETAKVWQSLSFDPEIDDFDNYILKAEIGAEAAMSENMSLRLVVEDRYDSTPVAGLDENDLKVIGGLSYKL